MNNQEFFIEDEEWSKDLEEKFEEYIWNCESLIDGEEPEEFTTLSGEPFDGCTTCYTREQLFFLVPRIIKAYKEGKITLNEE
jgi:hypothetical protein